MEDPKANPKEEKSVKELPITLLLNTLKNSGHKDRTKISFLLGSGVSASSGIPTGAALAEKWYKELEAILTEKELKKWQEEEETEERKGLGNPEQYAEWYSPIYQKRFGHCPEEGYNELKAIMRGKDPSLGYFILAQIISKTPNNIVLTTNFDTLLEDAVRSYTEKMPFEAGHELLADHVTSNTDCPIILKLHRDLLLHPRNTKEETGKLPAQWEKNLRNILSSSPLIVLGYGGNDGSLMDFLKELSPAERGPIYWCVRREEELSTDIKSVLKNDSDRFVLIKDFDDFMLRCAWTLEPKLESKKLFRDVVDASNIKDYPKIMEPPLRRCRKVCNKLGNLLLSLKDKEKLPDDLLQLLRAIYKEIYDIISQARQEGEANPEQADKIYREGIKQYPDSAILLGNYALFLKNVRKDYDKAEEYYLKAIDADPQNANVLGNYANYLYSTRKDYDKAEDYYKRALDADPQNANVLGNYANLLYTIRKDYDKAEEYYKRALDANPQYALALGNYAIFLKDIRKDYDKAEEYYKRALDADPKHANNLGNYATFLEEIRKNYDEAEEYYLKALDSNPQHANNLGNYAIFLKDIRKDYDKAEEHYLRALEIEPNNPVILRNYAIFLQDIRKDEARANEYFKRVEEAEQSEGV